MAELSQYINECGLALLDSSFLHAIRVAEEGHTSGAIDKDRPKPPIDRIDRDTITGNLHPSLQATGLSSPKRKAAQKFKSFKTNPEVHLLSFGSDVL